ncbi:MAG TPA: YbaK/EbsC family protein [Candidatus Paceibacterota bacterium]|nr:YbaK/EbsC family protein [Candidatus Pacearchaeota archaeon]HRZ51519.1 YbaK/EbsC family protein [Candidatus Paceibacterota bacterium]HSA37244.1 YbaK/EbsC family protein [Candidatus Paceibacterota bacterium]
MNKNSCPIPKKVDDFLKKSGVKFELIEHKTVYTANDKAATLKIKPAAVGKVLVMKSEGEPVIALVAGDRNLDMEKIKRILKAKKVDFLPEPAIKEKFKGIDPGAIPPFAEIWGVKVLADKKLLSQPKIVFSAGRYEWSLRLTPAVFKKISPQLITGIFSKAKEKKLKPKKKAVKTVKKVIKKKAIVKLAKKPAKHRKKK